MSSTLKPVVAFSDEIEDLLKSIALDEGLSDYTITKNVGSELGDGYASDITRIEIFGKDIKNENKNVYLVMKSAKEGEALRADINIGSIFQREIYLYDTVLPLFRLLEKEKDLPLSTFAPKFYKGTETINSEALIFEDLKKSDHRLYERRIPMDEAHIALVINQYGRLHALSYALRDQKPEIFQKIRGSMDDIFMKMIVEGDMKLMFIQKCVKVQELLDPNTDAKISQVYGDFVKTIEEFFYSLLSSVDDFSVILHGDCWTNNMMFKYEDENDPTKPTKVTLIDFQGSRWGSPVLDLTYFFYACSSKNIIDNVSYYIQLYYTSFSTYLRKLGSDPDKLYPYSVFQQHWKQYARYGLIFSILALHAMLTENDEIVDLHKAAEDGVGIKDAFEYEIANSDTYNDRVTYIIRHFVENNLI